MKLIAVARWHKTMHYFISIKIHCFQFYVIEANKAALMQRQWMMDKEKAYLFHIQLGKKFAK